jgi:thiol-disulfide isomerase/thioredoxin
MKSKILPIGLAILLAVVVIVTLFVFTKNSVGNNQPLNLTKNTNVEVAPQNSSENPGSPGSSVVSTATFVSGYADYDPAKLSNAQYGKVILFFHASWCPSCRGLENDIKRNVSSIPENMLILKVDYDSNQDLRKKYQIASQHTLVQVDASGQKIETNQGLYQLNTLQSVVEAFK